MSDKLVELACPPVCDGFSVASLIEEVRRDESLVHVRSLADKSMNGGMHELRMVS